ncbi:MAG: DM13 domain-containing protein [Stackebrandtia sp.]
MRKFLRRPVAGIVAAVVIVALVAAAWLFQPWLLFVDEAVDEKLPQPRSTSETSNDESGDEEPRGPVDVAGGDFVTQEHDTSGAARLVKESDGSHVLAIEGLDTSNGPDLRVWLTDQAVDPDEWTVFDDGYHVELGELKGNQGDQVYKVPDDTDLDKVSSVSIWCKRFSVSFGAAALG